MAGLDQARFSSIDRPSTPPVFADEVRAWQCAAANASTAPIRINAAALEGQVVYFNASDIPHPSHGPLRAGQPAIPASIRLLIPLFLVTLAGAVVLAWRNVRFGRGDRRGACRLAIFVFILEMLQWWAGKGFLPRALFDARLLVTGLQTACFSSLAIWCYYLGLEPYVRRYWPHSLLSWSRALVGRWRDPLIGLEVLIGAAFGIAVVVAGQCEVLLTAWSGRSAAPLWLSGPDAELGRLVGFGHLIGMTALSLRIAISRAILFLMLMLLLRKIIRVPWLAALAFVLIAAVYTALNTQAASYSAWLICGLVAVAVAALLVRTGFLAVVVSLFVIRLLLTSPITTDVHAWHAGTGAAALVLIAGLLAFGTYAACKPRPGPRSASA
jgi:hypothetical protein